MNKCLCIVLLAVGVLLAGCQSDDKDYNCMESYMIRLTDHEAGGPILVNKGKLDVARRLPAIDGGSGERTVIRIEGDVILVRETPEEIMRAEEYKP